MTVLFSALLTWLSPIIQRFVTILLFVTINKPIAHFVSVCWTWTYLTMVRIYKPAALKIAKSVSDQYYSSEMEWVTFVTDYINRFSGADIDPKDLLKQGLGRRSTLAMEAIGQKYLMPMLSMTLPSPEEVKRNPLGGAHRFLTLSLDMSMSGWLLHLISDMFSMGQFKALGQLPGAVSRAFGINRLARFVLGPSFKIAVVDPMTKVFNRIYVPEGYTKEQAANLLRHGLISVTEYIDICLDQGFSPTRAALLYEMGEKELTDAWLKRLTDMGWIKSAEIQKELTRRGFSPERAGILAKLIIDDRKLDLIDKVLNAAGNLYKDGVLDRVKLEGYLSKANYNRDEMELFIAQLDLERARRRFLTQAQVVQLWINKKYGRVECKDYLVNLLGMTAADAELYMSLKSPTI